MNLDSIYRLIEETQVFRMQRSSGEAAADGTAPASAPRDSWGSCVPPHGLPSPAPSASAHSCDGQWDVCEELRLRELEEVKARAAQMEKTMRWWSDCTANWRDKWSKVRAERNSAREEGRQLRIKLEMTVKELSALKKKQSSPPQKGALEAGDSQDRKRPGVTEASCAQRDGFQTGSQTPASNRECSVKRECPTKANISNTEEGLILNEEVKPDLDCADLLKNGDSKHCVTEPRPRQQAGRVSSESDAPDIPALRGHLDEFHKILRKEREMRSSLEKEVARLQSAVSLWKRKYEELKESTSANREEFYILHGQHKHEVEEISRDREEDFDILDNKDRVICELRAELERLREKNTSEWDQRETPETEKQGLERENGRRKVQVKEMDETAYSPVPEFQTPRAELPESQG